MANEPSIPGRVASPNDDVLASEAATYAFCAKAWHLEHSLRRSSTAEAVRRRSKGTALHEEHGARTGTLLTTGRRLVIWSAALLILAGVLVVLALLSSR